MVVMKQRFPIALILSIFLVTNIGGPVGVEARIRRTEEQVAKGDVGKIINGSFVTAGTYPWFTMLMYKSGSGYSRVGCGAMLVAPDVVLTAAHCMTSSFKSGPAVKIGALQSPYEAGNNGGQDLEFRIVSSIFIHPRYSSSTLINDFALLFLETPSTIAPVAIDSMGISDTYENGKDLWAIGLGYDENSVLPSKLKHVEVDYITNDDCMQPVNNYEPGSVTESMMCAARADKDSCQGDSGGPLLDIETTPTVVGIVSWGQGCAEAKYPGVYSRISSQFQWIKSTFCSNSNYNADFPFCETCSSSLLDGNTYYASKELNGKLSCWEIELKEGGFISRDDSDPDCTAEAFTTSAVLSQFERKISDGVYSFQKIENQGWAGNIKFKQKADITDPEIDVKSIDQVEFYLPDCSFKTCQNRLSKKFMLDLIADRYPEETSWDIKNDCTGDILISGKSESINVCMEPGSFTFTIRDSYEDGICCEYGDGSYSLYYDNNKIKTGGSFGKSESTTFGDQGCPSCQTSFLKGRTILLPAFSMCLKIQLFSDGQLTADETNENCSNDQFVETKIISSLTNMSGDTAYFSKSDAFSGSIKFRSDPNIQTPQVQTRSIDMEKKSFDIIVTLQSCLG